jgi:acyl carrier protein
LRLTLTVNATPALIEQLRHAPKPERAEVLRCAVVGEFRRTLLLTDGETLPDEQSYFDLGLTSLGLMEIKQRLESGLGRGIATEVLFNHPTVRQLIDHLTGEVLTDIFSNRRGSSTPTGTEYAS